MIYKYQPKPDIVVLILRCRVDTALSSRSPRYQALMTAFRVKERQRRVDECNLISSRSVLDPERVLAKLAPARMRARFTSASAAVQHRGREQLPFVASKVHAALSNIPVATKETPMRRCPIMNQK